MPILRLDEIRKMSASEREAKLEELRAEIMRLRTKVKAGGSIENPSRVREIKRTIARILTIEREEGGEKRQ